MNRAKPIFSVQLALLSAAVLLSVGQTAHAQGKGRGGVQKTSAAIAASRAAGMDAAVPAGQHVFYPANTAKIPYAFTTRKLNPTDAARVKGRAPGDSAVIKRTVLLTKFDPTLQSSYQQAPCNNQHPYWTNDEKYIYFDSDRNSDTDNTERTDGKYNIFRMFADGSGLTQIRTSTVHEIEPCISLDGVTMAFVAGGQLDYSNNGLDNPVSTGFNLYTYNVANAGTPLNLTANNPSGIVFSDVRHPSWNPGASLIAFQGQLGVGLPYHIFFVEPGTGVITQLTGPAPGTSAGIESNDTCPAWSPDGRVIAFTTNASAFSKTAPIQATALNPANQTTPGDTNQYDIWVMQPNAFAQDPHRVTTSKSIIGGAISSNKNAAWSTLKQDTLGNIPAENLLAFASTRANADPNNPGQANSVKSTFDIYFLHSQIAADPANPGAFTVTTPESAGNACIRLTTTSPGKTFDPAFPTDPAYSDPTFNFDPNFTSNEDYPAWPQYINSYRIAFQSDRGNSLQLWATTMIDINAPSLLRYDTGSNEIVRVARDSAPDVSVREVTPGEKVRFRVRAVDYESGIESVYLQVKCPNSSPQSADGKEHKTYYVGLGSLDTNLSVINAPYELDSQAINFLTYQFRGNGAEPLSYKQNFFVGPIPSNWPGWNQYVPGIDDALAFSGSSAPPDDSSANDYTGQGGFWLRLWDDGPIDDPQTPGHEPSGEIKGDGVYTANWVTPPNLPSDWYIDVIVRDNALDPFNPGAHTNWKIYDNVWGFTTLPFSGTSGILYVNDYDCGQKFFNANFGTFINAGLISNFQAETGSFDTGMFYNGVQTESWMTEMDPSLLPTSANNNGTLNQLVNVLTPLGAQAYSDALTQEPGNPIPVTARYDQWRVLSRGPVPDVVLNAYRGNVQQQPADVIAGGAGPRQVMVAPRMVLWHSPYPGDLFVGPGTILDADTQVRLLNFVKNGGRLCLNGTDLAWGLTLGGGSANPLLAQCLANFGGDFGGVQVSGKAGMGTNPIMGETWYPSGPTFYHNYPIVTPPDDRPGSGTIYLRAPLGNNMPPRFYSAPNGISADELQYLGTATADVTGVDATYVETGTPNTIWSTNSSATPIISKTVFIGFDLAAVNPEQFVPPNTQKIEALKNRHAEIMHNIGDYLRTGTMTGVVRDFSGGAPLSRVFVRCLSTHFVDTKGAPLVVGTAFTLADGSYQIDGLDCNGPYLIDAFKAGYISTHNDGSIFHGGYRAKVDLFIAQAKPGTITGTVTLQNTTTGAGGLIVVATDVVTGASFTGTTNTFGAYTILNVPASNYSVTIPVAPAGNLDTLGYGSCIPSSYGPAPAPKPQVVVPPNGTASGIDFQVTPLPGSISGLVTSHTPNGNPGNFIPSPNVTATDVNGVVVTVVGDKTGNYSFPSLVPGTYKVQATASGYRPSQIVNVVVATKANTVQNFVDDPNFPNDPTKQLALIKALPGSISGLVSTSLGIPVTGATITITDSGGNVLLTLTSGPLQTNGNYKFNYDTGMVVPAGATVTVSAAKTGYNPVTPPANPQSVTVAEATASTGVNFYLDPLHIFLNTLSLVSAPYEYSTVAGGSVASLLGIPSGDVSNGSFAFVTWTPSSGVYVNFPTPPADTFHLGAGYFMQDTNTSINLSLATPGVPAPPNIIYSIHLKPGWNLIGDPWSFPINFLNLKVIAADGTEEDILTAQTGTSPTLGAALWGFDNNIYEVSYTLDPWKGYWIRVFDNRPSAKQGTPADIVLLVDPAAQQNRAAGAPADTRFAMTAGNNRIQGWKLGLTASSGSQNAAPAMVGVMTGASNVYDRYKLEAPPAVGKQTVSVAIDHPEWNKQAGKYAVDLRPPGMANSSWNFTVTSTVPKQPVVLAWPAVATVSGKQDLLLTDTDTNTTVNLRTHLNYTIQAGSAGVIRHFTVTASTAKRVTLQVANVNAHLSGGGPGRAATSATIGYTLTADATTQVSVLKNGHVIRRIEQGSTRSAGDVALVWDLKNDQGVGVAADVYVLEVRAQDAQGHVARQITPLLLVR